MRHVRNPGHILSGAIILLYCICFTDSRHPTTRGLNTNSSLLLPVTPRSDRSPLNESLTGTSSSNNNLNSAINDGVNSTTPHFNNTNLSPNPEIQKVIIPPWERIGLKPGLFGLTICLLILSYLLGYQRNRIEHLYLFITIVVAGFGNLGAGLILSRVQNWPVFINISELLVLEPTLLGLKGNIEMTMASRLATQANMGNMDTWTNTFRMVRGNLALDLAQATTVAFLAGIGVVLLSLFKGTEIITFFYNLSIVVSTCLATACTASVILGSVLCTVVIVSYKLKMDPDNIGAPVGASLGDIITLTLFANYASLMYTVHPDSSRYPIIPTVIVTFLLVLLPIWFYVAYNNPYTRPSLGSGWMPIIIAVMLSTCSGFILDYAASSFERYAIFQPVINGIGGNLVAIHASRMSTSLHKTGSLGELPNGVKMVRNPVRAFYDKTEPNIEMARNLVMMSVPAHILYLFVTAFVQDNTFMSIQFMVVYVVAAICQILCLLYIAYHFVNLMWSQGVDPDNTSIPILTALGDFLGSLFLYLSFMLLKALQDPNCVS